MIRYCWSETPCQFMFPYVKRLDAILVKSTKDELRQKRIEFTEDLDSSIKEEEYEEASVLKNNLDKVNKILMEKIEVGKPAPNKGKKLMVNISQKSALSLRVPTI